MTHSHKFLWLSVIGIELYEIISDAEEVKSNLPFLNQGLISYLIVMLLSADLRTSTLER